MDDFTSGSPPTRRPKATKLEQNKEHQVGVRSDLMDSVMSGRKRGKGDSLRELLIQAEGNGRKMDLDEGGGGSLTAQAGRKESEASMWTPSRRSLGAPIVESVDTGRRIARSHTDPRRIGWNKRSKRRAVLDKEEVFLLSSGCILLFHVRHTAPYRRRQLRELPGERAL